MFKPNKIIKHLVLGELVFWTGWGFLTPLFAIFVVDKIDGGSAFVVGMASAVFWISRSILRVPFGVLVDFLPSEKDDYFIMVLGFFIAALVPFGYLFSSSPWHIYLLQAIYGLGLAMSYAGFTGIFTKHVDKGKVSTEWGLSAVAVGVGTGFAGALGGWAVTHFGFDLVFVLTGIFGLLGALALLRLRHEIKGVFDNGFAVSLRGIFAREINEI